MICVIRVGLTIQKIVAEHTIPDDLEIPQEGCARQSVR
jgi:hypothetical protein